MENVRYVLISTASNYAVNDRRMRNSSFPSHNGGKINEAIIMAIQVNRETQNQVEDGESFGPQLVGKLEVKETALFVYFLSGHIFFGLGEWYNGK